MTRRFFLKVAVALVVGFGAAFDSKSKPDKLFLPNSGDSSLLTYQDFKRVYLQELQKAFDDARLLLQKQLFPPPKPSTYKAEFDSVRGFWVHTIL